MKWHARCCGYASFAGLKGIKSSCLAQKRVFYNLILRYFSGFIFCSMNMWFWVDASVPLHMLVPVCVLCAQK